MSKRGGKGGRALDGNPKGSGLERRRRRPSHPVLPERGHPESDPVLGFAIDVGGIEPRLQAAPGAERAIDAWGEC